MSRLRNEIEVSVIEKKSDCLSLCHERTFSISAARLTYLYFSKNHKIHIFLEYTEGNSSP